MSAPPIQPMHLDAHGAVRFRPNAIVDLLLSSSHYDLNQLARMDFPVADREQFAMLIGYSLGGFAELGYVTDATYERAEKAAKDKGLIL